METKEEVETGKVSDEQKLRISALWDTLKRYDNYIGTVNFKSGLITTLNAAVFGGVVLKSDVLVLKDSLYRDALILNVVVIAFLSLLSIYWVIKSIWPNLKSASTGTNRDVLAPSLFFFGSVSSNFNAKSYAESFRKVTVEEMEKDLSVQVHEVAAITSLKFKTISTASLFTKLNVLALLSFGVIQLLQSVGYTLCRA
ncbi:Pycsar system effector family protein [Pseudomonas frederiksbergensis]|uniref:Pycsar system effector family protein n=1 Tax=Pseudomonas frederiksbergensis TaxID=104087 RepID=UPI000F49E141|nr:Pycsar system effector family protein [Pseudomonas frederiksbergensis]RON43690.1 hypothetical protein BK667_28505 [Pseudomonas frederiksbergensis]